MLVGIIICWADRFKLVNTDALYVGHFYLGYSYNLLSKSGLFEM